MIDIKSNYVFFIIILLILLYQMNIIDARRGPHHPRGETVMSRGHSHMAEHIDHGKDHLQEDLNSFQLNENEIDSMTDEEKHFYYFKIHDSDNNDNLDGLEMLYAATHHTGHFHRAERNQALYKIEDELNHIIDVIDEFIDIADLDRNGFLNYPEYKRAIKNNDEENNEANSLIDPEATNIEKEITK